MIDLSKNIPNMVIEKFDAIVFQKGQWRKIKARMTRELMIQGTCNLLNTSAFVFEKDDLSWLEEAADQMGELINLKLSDTSTIVGKSAQPMDAKTKQKLGLVITFGLQHHPDLFGYIYYQHVAWKEETIDVSE